MCYMAVGNRYVHVWGRSMNANENSYSKVELLPLDLRHETFALIIDYLEEKYGYNSVALCKEPVLMWDSAYCYECGSSCDQ
jgi:hypothetical protein